MKLETVLIVAKDIERSRQFYHDLFGFELVLDHDGNMILTEGLVLQEEKPETIMPNKTIIFRLRNGEDKTITLSEPTKTV